MFWRREKPKPWYKKLWAKFEAVVIAVSVIAGAVGGFISFVSIDTSSFEETTEVIAVTDHAGNLFVEISSATDLPEHAYIVININGTQLANYVYPDGIVRGKSIYELEIPHTHLTHESFPLLIDLVLVGPRTLFRVERLTVKLQVENNYEGISNPTSAGIHRAIARMYHD